MSPKKRQDPRLPKYVSKGTSAWLYIPYKAGEPRKSYRLCGLDASIAEIWAAHEKLLNEERPNTLRWLLTEYRNSPAFTTHKGKPKSSKTTTEQSRQIDAIFDYATDAKKPFGQALLVDIKPGSIRQFLDWRLANDAGVAGNREVSIISKAWNWARERDKVILNNPCIGVTRNPSEPRQHYATDHNYDGWLRYLDEKKAPEFLYIASELTYLCRMRKIECLTATKSQVLPEGFDTLRRKGSRDAITSYSSRLKAVLKRCDKLAKRSERGRFSQYLILTNSGQPVRVNGFDSSWQRHMKAALKLGYVQERFTHHDLKRKGATDSDQDATISTGNSESMSKVYDVSKIDAKPTK